MPKGFIQIMYRARLTAISLASFKSYAALTRLDLNLLTVLIGRNNSGKSSVIQAMLLLKQTLKYANPDVPLRLEGDVEALSIRELTHGWPEAATATVKGPTFLLEWESRINVDKAQEEIQRPHIADVRAGRTSAGQSREWVRLGV